MLTISLNDYDVDDWQNLNFWWLTGELPEVERESDDAARSSKLNKK